MAPTKVMFIRHAEKPQKSHSAEGVGEHGHADSKDLTVRGWQRAGALVRFFAPLDGHFTHPRIARPDHIFAPGLGAGSRSQRARQTVEPLSKLIGVPITDMFLKGQEGALASAILNCEGVVLVSWEHKEIGAIIDHVVAGSAKAPSWPENRFDVVVVLDRAGGGWSLRQVPQMLLAGDENRQLS